jgi:hypothetical protein
LYCEAPASSALDAAERVCIGGGPGSYDCSCAHDVLFDEDFTCARIFRSTPAHLSRVPSTFLLARLPAYHSRLARVDQDIVLSGVVRGAARQACDWCAFPELCVRARCNESGAGANGSFVCRCPKFTALALDARSCADVDECQLSLSLCQPVRLCLYTIYRE